MTEVKPSQTPGRYTLDVKGYACPYPQYYTMWALQDLQEGEVLEVVLDNQPSIGIVQDTARKKGYTVLSADKIEGSTWRIEIRK